VAFVQKAVSHASGRDADAGADDRAQDQAAIGIVR
jgi:hypothetical protein